MGITGYYNAAARSLKMKAVHLELANNFIQWMKMIRDFGYDKEVKTSREWLELYRDAVRYSSDYLREKARLKNPPGVVITYPGRFS